MTKLVVKKLYTIEIESEICCDECNEIVHNHIVECPVCKAEFASTDQYCDLNEKGYEVDIIQCEECNTYFKLVDGNWYGDLTEEELLIYTHSYNFLAPKVIVVDAPIKEIKETSKATYTLDPKTIEAMKNFKLFESLSEGQTKNFFLK